LTRLNHAKNTICNTPFATNLNSTEQGNRTARELSKAEEPVVKSRVVEDALKSLTSRVNISTGIAHPSDRSVAIQMLNSHECW